MAHSVNSTPLLQEFDSSDNDDEFTSIIDENVVDSTRDDDKISFIKPIAEPKDKYYVAYIIFYLLGMVTLLPWNFFITADDVRIRFFLTNSLLLLYRIIIIVLVV